MRNSMGNVRAKKMGRSEESDTPRELNELAAYLIVFTLEKILPRVSRLLSLSFFEIQ